MIPWVRQRPGKQRVDDDVKGQVLDPPGPRIQARVSEDDVVKFVKEEERQFSRGIRVLADEVRVHEHARLWQALHGRGRDVRGLDDVHDPQECREAVGACRQGSV